MDSGLWPTGFSTLTSNGSVPWQFLPNSETSLKRSLERPLLRSRGRSFYAPLPTPWERRRVTRMKGQRKGGENAAFLRPFRKIFGLLTNVITNRNPSEQAENSLFNSCKEAVISLCSPTRPNPRRSRHRSHAGNMTGTPPPPHFAPRCADDCVLSYCHRVRCPMLSISILFPRFPFYFRFVCAICILFVSTEPYTEPYTVFDFFLTFI